MLVFTIQNEMRIYHFNNRYGKKNQFYFESNKHRRVSTFADFRSIFVLFFISVKFHPECNRLANAINSIYFIWDLMQLKICQRTLCSHTFLSLAKRYENVIQYLVCIGVENPINRFRHRLNGILYRFWVTRSMKSYKFRNYDGENQR